MTNNPAAPTMPPPPVTDAQVRRLGLALLAVARLAADDAPRVRRDGERELSDASLPIVDALHKSLLARCDGLMRCTQAAPFVDGSDLAQEAWQRTLKALMRKAADGDGFDATHFVSYLYRASASSFLDIVRRASATYGKVEIDAPHAAHVRDALLAPQSFDSVPNVLRFAADTEKMAIVEALFTDKGAFRRLARGPVKRSVEVFQAIVLYDLAAFVAAETVEEWDGYGAVSSAVALPFTLAAQFADAIYVLPQWWSALEQVVRQSNADGTVAAPALLATVNALCDTNLTAGNTLSVVRHDWRMIVS